MDSENREPVPRVIRNGQQKSGWKILRTRIILSIIAGAALSAAGFYYSLRHVPLGDLAAYMGTVDYWWIAPAALLGLSSFVIRALRWQAILGTSVRLPFGAAYHPLMIGFMINSVLPGRVGEIARPAIIRKKENVPFSLGLATVGAERMLDGITLVLLFTWMSSAVAVDPDMEMSVRGHYVSGEVLENLASGMIVVSIVLLALVAAMNIRAVQRLLKRAVLGIPDLIAPVGARRERLRKKIFVPAAHIIDHTAAGLSLLRHPGKLLVCCVYSAAIWLSQAAVFYIAVLGSPRISITFTQSTTVFIIVCLFIILPSVPGFWGVWEAGGVFGLALFGVPATDALGFSLAVHAVLLFPVMFAGIVSAVVTGVNILRAGYGGRQKNS